MKMKHPLNPENTRQKKVGPASQKTEVGTGMDMHEVRPAYQNACEEFRKRKEDAGEVQPVSRQQKLPEASP